LKKLGTIIHAARTTSGLSQQALGDIIGVWPTYIGQIEKGIRIPSDEVIVKLAQTFGLRIETLLLVGYYERAETKHAKLLFRNLHTYWNSDNPDELDLPKLNTQQRSALKNLYGKWLKAGNSSPSPKIIFTLCNVSDEKIETIEEIVKAFES
jgi:transcriptional regulator with XRE-family HTH domain